ncbi:YeiH family protein [Parvularcula marina]|uniref:Putative sulfate exporter family transporter n=1 Tax=Parvularcula marina TaxID=2292771 RepID=A0A371RL71_9PROT|nr:putative sulfate exporter family transporter [Parvularcula marina]RFB06203.1 putative sulfate exporter family transporter [Parvularcula marina]
MTALALRDRLGKAFGALGPGVLIAFTVAAASMFISEHYNAPVMLMALLLGMAFNFLSEDNRCAAGIQFTSSRLLKIGVACLGVRVTFDQIMSVGAVPLISIPIFIVLTIALGALLARLMDRPIGFGFLTGGAVAICGASAALALSAVLPKTEVSQRNTLFTVIAVTTLSTLAMIAYPIIFTNLGFSDVQSGILIGATIHDVAQVVGAGYAISDEAGNVATYVKMMRVAMLPVVIIAFSLYLRRGTDETAKAPMPWFAISFGIVLLVNSLGILPGFAVEAIRALSQWLLVAAIAALGMKTSMKAMLSLGGKHIGMVVLETLFLLVMAIGVVALFIPE